MNGSQIIQQLAAQRAAGHRAALAAIAGGREVGTMGWGGGYDVLGSSMGGVRVEGAGLVDVVGLADALSMVPAPQRRTIASMLQQQMAAPTLAESVQVLQQQPAVGVLQRPLGLPPNSQMAVDVPGVARKQYIGLGPRIVAIPAAGAVDIIAQPQSVARIERLIIESIGTPTASGRDFTVTRVDIGDVRQISGQGEIPGLAFSAEGFQLDVKLDTSNPGNTIQISLENVSAGPITIALIGIGTVVR